MTLAIVEPEKKFVDRCMICGCTPLNPCKTTMDGQSILSPTAKVIPCHWINADHSLCSNYLCIARVPMASISKMRLLRGAFAEYRP